eukprot:gene39156-41881_t
MSWTQMYILGVGDWRSLEADGAAGWKGGSFVECLYPLFQAFRPEHAEFMRPAVLQQQLLRIPTVRNQR